MKLTIGQIKFQFVCHIVPEKGLDGAVRQYMPQDRYENEKGLPLNTYGKGPFCKFKIPRDWGECGVYAIVLNGAVKYIGECVNLTSRYNMGYGNISPRNCFVGGQETNCRINNHIYNEAQQDKEIDLWFFATGEYKAAEEQLRSEMQLEWNRV